MSRHHLHSHYPTSLHGHHSYQQEYHHGHRHGHAHVRHGHILAEGGSHNVGLARESLREDSATFYAPPRSDLPAHDPAGNQKGRMAYAEQPSFFQQSPAGAAIDDGLARSGHRRRNADYVAPGLETYPPAQAQNETGDFVSHRGQYGPTRLTVTQTGWNSLGAATGVMTLSNKDGIVWQDEIASGGRLKPLPGLGVDAGREVTATYPIDYKDIRYNRGGGFSFKDGNPGFSISLDNAKDFPMHHRKLFRIHTAPYDYSGGCVAICHDQKAKDLLKIVKDMLPSERPYALEAVPTETVGAPPPHFSQRDSGRSRRG